MPRRRLGQDPDAVAAVRAIAPSASGYRADIDGLRAVAVILVILFHAFPDYPSGGFVGVDMFFVISGYLISGILIDEFRRGTFSLLRFYARRCRRIVPALSVVLLAVLVAGWLLLLPEEYRDLGVAALGAGTFLTNIQLISQAGYFDKAAAVKPLLHLWSLGVEEQYYLIWPLLLWAAYRWRLRLGPIIAGLFVASFALMLVLPQYLAFYLLPPRFWELLMGGALAYIQRRHAGCLGKAAARCVPAPWSAMLPHIAGLGALALLAWSVLTLTEASPFPGWNALPPTAAAAMLIAAGGHAWMNRVILSQPAAVFVGRISFPLYLWHWPLLSFARIIVGALPPVGTRLTLVALAFILAWATWRWIERPVQRLVPNRLLITGSRDAVRLVAAACGALILLAVSGAMIGYDRTVGRMVAARSVADGTVRQINSYVSRLELKSRPCPPQPSAGFSWCVANNQEQDRFALLGDSHAEHLLPGLLGRATAADGWLFMGRAGCPPALNVEISFKGTPQHCDVHNAWALDYLRQRSDISTVVLSSLTMPYFNDAGPSAYARDGINHLVSSSYGGSSQDKYRQGMADMIGALTAAGKIVVLMIDLPELDFDPSRCHPRPLQAWLAGADNVRCTVPRAAYEARRKPFMEMVGALRTQYPRLLVYDPIDLFCDAKDCHALIDGQPLYRDSDHLSLFGSLLAGQSLLKWMAAQGLPVSPAALQSAIAVGAAARSL